MARPSVASDLRLKPQTKSVLRHLMSLGHISTMEAFIVHGITRLAACVYDLREAGYVIHRENCRDIEGQRYTRYVLEKERFLLHSENE